MSLIKVCVAYFLPSIVYVNRALRINFINRQKRAISLELLRNIEVKIVNRCIKYIITNNIANRAKSVFLPEYPIIIQGTFRIYSTESSVRG